MKISKIETFLTCNSRNFLTVKITTESGVFGYGDATLNGREKAVETYISEHLAPCLLGMDSRQIEHIWHYLYKGAYWRNGAVMVTAISAIDMALWDIKGKVANMPVYQLLGGKSREKFKVYGHANGNTIEETLDNLGKLIEQGFKAVRLQCSIPGQEGTYGTLNGKKDYYALQSDRPLPPIQVWETQPYLQFIPNLFKQAREKYGFEVELLHDVHSRLTPIEAASLGKDLEPYKLLFLEDPIASENQVSFQKIRQHTTTPLAVGEVFSSIWDAKTLIETESIDYLRMAATHCGGITPMRKIAQFADLFHVKIAPHGPPDISPIGHSASAHINLWANNFGIQEFVGFGGEELNAVFKTPLSFSDGYLFIEEKPGLGVEFDEIEAQKSPYKRSYLPVCQLKDGSIWNW